MVENKSSLFGILALIIGASGLGLGVFSVVNFQILEVPQGLPGEDGTDGLDGIDGEDGTDAIIIENIYYCSSQSEIEEALDTIDSSHGTIIITEDITLNSTINIDKGGRYIIQGAGPVILNRNANDETFNISNVKSCTIKELIINASDITSASISGIHISEGNDNTVYVLNVQIDGGNEGRGVDVNSENVWIQNCYISGFRIGIYLRSSSAYCHILDNLLGDMNISSGDAYGIHLDTSDYNTLTGNTINNIEGSFNAIGIYLDYSDSNTLTGNTISNIDSTTYAVGINVVGGYNMLTGNRVDAITANNQAAGISVSVDSDYNNIIGNIITAILGSGGRYGIRIFGDWNVFVGNTLINCGSGIGNTGMGNEIANNVVL